jgi:transposase
LHGGYDALLSRHETPRKQRLSPQKQRIIRFILLHKHPVDYGIDSYQWTAKYLKEVIYQKWEIPISAARLYQLFDEWGLSFQKAHRDYSPTNALKQAEFIDELKKTAQLDEQSAMSLRCRLFPIRIMRGQKKIPSLTLKAMNDIEKNGTVFWRLMWREETPTLSLASKVPPPWWSLLLSLSS